MLDTSVPADEGTILYNEHPCGFSYCYWFNPVMSFLETPTFSDEAEKDCSGSNCRLTTCRLDGILVVCCDGQNSWERIRLRTLKQIREDEEKEKARERVSRSVDRLEKDTVDKILPNFRRITSSEAEAVLAERLTWADTKKIGSGKSICFETEDFSIAATGDGQKLNVRVLAADKRYSDNLKAFTIVNVSFAWLLQKIFWEKEAKNRGLTITVVE